MRTIRRVCVGGMGGMLVKFSDRILTGSLAPHQASVFEVEVEAPLKRILCAAAERTWNELSDPLRMRRWWITEGHSV